MVMWKGVPKNTGENFEIKWETFPENPRVLGVEIKRF